MAETKNKTSKTKKVTKTANFFSGTGRRKRSVARVWLYEKKGEFIVNDKPIKEYFPEAEDTLEWVSPFHTIGVSHPQAKFSATIKVSGGGTNGQLEAVKHGLSRAIVAYDESHRSILRISGFLTRDSRKVERKKAFFRKARKKPQYSKR